MKSLSSNPFRTPAGRATQVAGATQCISETINHRIQVTTQGLGLDIKQTSNIKQQIEILKQPFTCLYHKLLYVLL